MTMFKKVFGVVVSLLLTLNAMAAFEVNGLYYSVISEDEKMVKVEPSTASGDNYADLAEARIPETVSYNGNDYTVTAIAYNAFNNAKNLTSVSIPKSVTKIENVGTYFPEWNAFYNSLKISSITVDAGNPNYTSVDGVLFDKEKTTLINYPTAKTDITYTIPDGVTTICTYAFNSCSLTDIVLPSSFTTLGYIAFYNCTKLRSITCYAINPPKETMGWAFVNINQETLYVPEEAVDTYKNDALWKAFSNILPIPSNLLKLDETDENTSATLQTEDGKTVDAELIRSFIADGAWYTLCLPFALTEEEVEEAFGECELMKLNYSQKQSDDLLYVNFSSVKTIDAGTPYLFRPAEDVDNPIFKGVTIDAQASTEVAPTDGLVKMTGIYSPMEVPTGKWYMGPSNTLYQPQSTVRSKGFRAYFELAPSLDAQKIRARVVMNGQVSTDMDLVPADSDTAVQKIVENGHIYIVRNGERYDVTGMRIN